MRLYKNTGFKAVSFPDPLEYDKLLKSKGLRTGRRKKDNGLEIGWRFKLLHIKPIDCKCGNGKYIPSKKIDACPLCLFKRRH